ncbi:MAG: hypothetical protein A2149_07630 [Candidatus Schekmanbacteria bacterium RBG_16_38_11]|uniref:Clp R domain-containing protein n=1 Tax=Candidatus Schekmanbacteria bacterium RBG_16_38_11 TaxID=1817880 RepID=A0A1F7RZM5_9BACT|nr:MAG: hypothetical protein A2149_07630 [Candidatus Schekmanbacteria bacterium RBG_16_38_11]
MIELENLRGMLSESGQKALSLAIEESQKRGQNYLGIEHLFLALTEVEKSLFFDVMAELHLNPSIIIHALNQHLNIAKLYSGEEMKVLPATKNIFRQAWDDAQSSGRKTVEATDLLIAIFQESHGMLVKIIRSLGIEPSIIVEKITHKVRTREEKGEEFKKKYELPPYLKHFGINLNKLARLDKLPPIIGREEEIRQVMEILYHKERANSVMIIGESGVGKTAIAEGLAKKIELSPQNIPPRLRNCQIINLQMNTIVAGTMFRGMFEDRIQNIINELKERPNLILFVDEAHSLIGAGSAMGVPSDAANIFKSSLARGEIRIIGATTATEYKAYIQEDEALSRRFRAVSIKEPTIEEAREIVLGVKPRLERNYSVKISEEAIDTVLEMSPRYMRSLRLPDKAIGWLDTAAVKVEINRLDRPVTKDDVIEVISQEADIPRDMIFRDTTDRFKDIEKELSRRVVGQKEAISALANRLRLNKGPLKENFDKPDGVLLFLGPTGVGKTEMSKALAKFLFGDEKKMIRLDMSEYRDSAISVDKLIGMPRGIVGSERGGILTNQVKDNPLSVLLLDEMEKANSYVLNIFLQIFDEGWITDGRGKKVYFSDTIIIMTSNFAAEKFKRLTKPFGFLSDVQQFDSVKKEVLKEVENTFSPEFINRIDDIIVFSPLTEEEIKEITKIYLSKINEFLITQGKEMMVEERVIEILTKIGFSIKYGARFLKRTIDEKVKIPITLNWKKSSKFLVSAKGEEIVVDWEH